MMVKLRSYRIGVSPKSNMTGYIIKREIWTQTLTSREGHMKTEAETAVMRLQAKKQEGPEARRGMEQVLSQSLQKEPTLPTTSLLTSGLHN